MNARADLFKPETLEGVRETLIRIEEHAEAFSNPEIQDKIIKEMDKPETPTELKEEVKKLDAHSIRKRFAKLKKSEQKSYR